MNPQQARFLLDEIYLPQIHGEHKTTLRVIEAIPADRASYQPDPKAKSAWDLATHIVSAEIFFLHGAARGAFEGAGAAIPDSVKTPADLSHWYQHAHAEAVAALAAASDETLTKPTKFAIFELPAVEYARFMTSHTIHHRGQLSTYLRPMGSKVPSIYGGSADEPIEAARAQAE